MDKKKLMLLLGALVIAIGTALAARSMLTGSSSPQANAAEAPKGPKVLVAQRALQVGTIIAVDSVSFQAWPKEMVQDAYFIDGEADMSKLLGTVVRYPITAGQPLTKGALVAPGDRGFLAAALGAGMRAVTIPVSSKTGVGGFIFPGDRVDLVVTQIQQSASEGETFKASETFLRNIRVLATDQSTETETVDGKTVVHEFRTVTLEVTPRYAEKIAVAQTIGTLSLSLRSLADSQSQLDQVIASGSVKVPAGASRAEEERILNMAANRPNDAGTTAVTAGDVSRYQRKSPAPIKSSNDGNSGGGTAQGASVQAVVVPRGPVVRVYRGKAMDEVPVSGGR